MSIGALIFLSIVGSFICARARVAGGAVIFALVAFGLFIGTSAGAGLPEMISHFLSTIDSAATPVLNGGSRAAG